MRCSLAVFTLPIAIFVSTDANCADGFVPFYGGNCFKIDTVVGEWDEVEADCLQAGGKLTSIHSGDENSNIVAAIPSDTNFWIGMKCENNTVRWVDASPVDYTNYHSAPDSCPDGGKFHMWTYYGSWYLDGTTNLQGICRHARRNGERCFDFNEITGTGTCYSIHTDQQSWNNAEQICKNQSAHLIAIHNDDVNDGLARLIGYISDATGGFHIGMQSNSSAKGESLSWTDGSPVDYVKFAKGFPADSFGHCTAMETLPSPGPWMTTQCDTSALSYICGRQAPHPIVPPGCPTAPFFADGGLIYSPAYPLSSGQLSCDYFLVVPQRKKVQITIEDLNTNLCCDKLYLYNGFESTAFATLSGVPGSSRIYTSTGNEVKMTYKATDSTFVRGWKVSFTAV